MRIVILQDWLRGGGTEKHTVLLANGFAAAGEYVTVLTYRPGGALAGSLKVPHEVLQLFDTRLNFLSPGLVARVRSLAPDAVLAMGYEANRKLPLLRRKLPGLRLIATLRGGRTLSRQYRQAFAVADAVIANSSWARGRAIEAGTNAAKTFVVNNLLGDHPPTPSAESRLQIREALATEPEDCVLICLAGFRRGKGQAELVGMLAPLLRNPGLRLWLVGDGPQRVNCEKLAEVLDIADRVVFPGRRVDALAVLQAADMCVHASRTESQPNALIEAQACGLPVVAWDTAGVGETFIDGESGLLVPYGEVRGFAEAAARLIGDAGLRAAFGQRGRAFALEKFDDAKNLQATLAPLRGEKSSP